MLVAVDALSLGGDDSEGSAVSSAEACSVGGGCGSVVETI